MRATCQAWCNRILSYKGKVTVFNALVISLLQYMAANTRIPPRVFVEVKKLACDFIWVGKRSKITYSTIIQGTEEGGLRLMDLQAMAQANLISWAKRIILSLESTAGNLIKVYCGVANPILIWTAKRDFSNCLSKVFPFYTSVIQAWHKFHNTKRGRRDMKGNSN